MSEYIIWESDRTEKTDYLGVKHGVSHFEKREEIVRCRDCDFSHEDELGNLRCNGPLTEPWDYYNDEPSDGVKVEPDGFCAWGERKEGGE